MPNSAASKNGGKNSHLIPKALNSRGQQTPNLLASRQQQSNCKSSRPLPEEVRTQSQMSQRPPQMQRSKSQMSFSRAPSQNLNGHTALDSSRFEIKDLVKDAVKEYFDSLDLPQMMDSHRGGGPGVGFASMGAPVGATEREFCEQHPELFRGYDDKGDEIWAVVKKDPYAELLNSHNAPATSRPSSRMLQNAFWNNEDEFQSNLQNWASTAPEHEREIVSNLLKKLNGGKTPTELNCIDKTRLRKSTSGVPHKKFTPFQFQCDSSMFTKPPYNPQRHFIINPEWTSERLTVKRIPAAHLHPTATLKNKLGLLRS